MTDLPRHPDTDEDAGVGADRGAASGTSWGTYVFGGIVIGVVLLFVVLHLTGTLGPGAH